MDTPLDGSPTIARDSSLHARKPQLLAQRIYAALLRGIVIGELNQGEFLSEVQLAEKFQTSRTPIREACIHLFKEGLLRVAPHKGYVVTEISLDEIRELYQLRQILEPEAAAMAATSNFGQETSAKLKELLDEMSRLAHQERSYEVFLKLSELEHSFHYSIAEASGNRKLAKFISELMNQFRRYYYANFQRSPWMESVVEEHKAILAAICAHDGPRARQLMYEHIATGSERASKLFWRSISPREQPPK